MARFCVVVCLFVVAIFSSARAQKPPTTNPLAIDRLQTCLDASGGTAKLASIADYTALGSITYFWAGKEVQGSAVVRAKGSDKFRLDASVDGGLRTWIENLQESFVQETDGSIHISRNFNLLNQGSLTLPVLNLARFVSNPLITPSYIETVKVSGRQADQLRFSYANSKDDLLPAESFVDVFLDSETCAIVKVSNLFYPTVDSLVTYRHDLYLSNYKSVDGVMVPLSITEVFADQTTWNLQLQSVTFNGGLNDSDFTTEKQPSLQAQRSIQ